jgi:hypothetical protein
MLIAIIIWKGRGPWTKNLSRYQVNDCDCNTDRTGTSVRAYRPFSIFQGKHMNLSETNSKRLNFRWP